MAIANDGSLAGDYIRKTSDGGKSWHHVLIDTLIIREVSPDSTFVHVPLINRALAFTDPNHAFTACDSGVVRRSSDAGQNWQRIQLDTKSRLYRISMFDSVHGAVPVAPSGQEILLTNDGWLSWVSIDMEQVFRDYDPSIKLGVTDLAMLSRNSLVVLSNNNGKTTVFRSSDSGRSWDASPGPPHCRQLKFINQELGWAAGDSLTGIGHLAKNIVYKTIDGGRTWTDRSVTEFENTPTISAFSFADELNGLIVGQSGKVFISNSGGDSWFAPSSPPDLPASINISAVAFAGPNVAYIGTGTGTGLIYRYDVRTVSVDSKDLLPGLVVHIYPNPAHTNIEVRFPPALVDRPTGIAVYNINGNSHYIRKFESVIAESSFFIDISALPIGTYLLSINFREGTYSRSFTVTR